MKFATYQMKVIPGDPDANREKVKTWVEKVVAEDKPDTVVLPELWTTSFMLKELKFLADEGGETTKSFLSSLASANKVNIIGGSIANKVGEEIYNTSYVYNSKGELVYEYSKIHLVPMLDEPSYLTGGKEKVEVFELDGIKMGVIICYDLRFPELARTLALKGAQVMFIVAQWPTPRRLHWKHIQLARAIENQMYIVSCNGVGNLNGVEYSGTSMMIDSWGDILQEGATYQEETLISELDVERVLEVRKEVPIFESRVPELY